MLRYKDEVGWDILCFWVIETAEEGKCINSGVRLNINPEGKKKFCCAVYPEFSVGSKAGMKFISHDPCISQVLQEKHRSQPAGEYLLKGLCIVGARTGRETREAP